MNSYSLRVDSGLVVLNYGLLILTANDCLELLKSIQSLALIVFSRDLNMKVSGPNQAFSASFSLRVDGGLVVSYQ